MSAIRNGHFKLKSAQQPAQQAAQKPADARQALFSAIKNREFNLKTVSPAADGQPGRIYLCAVLHCVLLTCLSCPRFLQLTYAAA